MADNPPAAAMTCRRTSAATTKPTREIPFEHVRGLGLSGAKGNTCVNPSVIAQYASRLSDKGSSSSSSRGQLPQRLVAFRDVASDFLWLCGVIAGQDAALLH